MVVDVWCSDSDTWIDDTHSNALSNLLSRLNETEVLRTEETQGSTDKKREKKKKKRRATNGVEQRRLDELAQRKRVEIHDGLGSNKVDGLFELWRMNKRQVEQLAGASIKQ